jgi:hypothetical protein
MLSLRFRLPLQRRFTEQTDISLVEELPDSCKSNSSDELANRRIFSPPSSNLLSPQPNSEIASAGDLRGMFIGIVGWCQRANIVRFRPA